MGAPGQDSNSSRSDNNPIKNVFAGSLSSSLSRLVGQPLEILKIRFQLQQLEQPLPNFIERDATTTGRKSGRHHRYNSMPQAVHKIYSEEGLRGFWRGHCMSQFQGFFQGIVMFWAFEEIRAQMNRTRLQSFPKLCNFASGFATGALIVVCTSPTEVLQTHIIAQSADERKSVFALVRELNRSAGVRSYFHGGYTAMLHCGSLLGCKFMFYNIICDLGMHVTKGDARDKLPAAFLLTAGAASGVSAHLVTYPMDLVKRRLQVKSSKSISYSGPAAKCVAFLQCFRLVLKNDGMLGLYKGILPCLLKSAVSTALQFSAYDKLRLLADKIF